MLRNLDLMAVEPQTPFAGDCFKQAPALSCCISTAPVGVITERLVLRPVQMSDFPAFEKLMADPDTFRHSDRGPMTADEAWTRFLRQAGHWSMLDYGLFAVTDRKSGEFLGEVGFGDFRRGLGEHFDGHPEASWTIVGHARGKGIATEAAQAALTWLEETRGPERTVCLIHVENEHSIRIAHRLGYRLFEERAYRGYPALMFGRPQSDSNCRN